MSASEIVVAVLLALGTAGFALTAAGLLISGNAWDQIHFLAPASVVGSVLIPIAVLLHEGFSQAAVKAIAIALILVLSNPVLSHATARAARIRRKGRLESREKGHIPFAEDSD
jgi:multicomponent Na+:H+ antiporter subunit G